MCAVLCMYVLLMNTPLHCGFFCCEWAWDAHAHSANPHYVSYPLPHSFLGSSSHWTALNLDSEGLPRVLWSEQATPAHLGLSQLKNKQWAWDAHVQFAQTEGYQGVACSHHTVTAHLRCRVQQQGWKPGANACIALMSLLGKAKSLGRHKILWRPIAAVSRPFVSHHSLRLPHVHAHACRCYHRLYPGWYCI